jgi:hypothetical protein
MFGHEIYDIGRRHLRRDDKIALVFAVFVIDQNEHPAIAGVLDQFFDIRFIFRKHQVPSPSSSE